MKTDKDWKKFKISDIFEIKNSKAYHKTYLKITTKGLPYISRSNLNNGLEDTVEEKAQYKLNDQYTICFGAENATFFMQPYKYITGNKMYYLKYENANKYISLFLCSTLNKSIKNGGFGYGKGLTGTRLMGRSILLPTKSNQPDYKYMEQYMKDVEKKLKVQYKQYFEKLMYKYTCTLNSNSEHIKWKSFYITDLFNIRRGNQNNMQSLTTGETPLVSAKKIDNGYKGFVSAYNALDIYEKESLSLNNDGDGGAGIAYYQPYYMLLDTHVTQLIPKKNYNRYILLFFSNVITKQRNKFGHGYSLNNVRLNKFKFMLPVGINDKIAFDYMELYMKNIEYKQLIKYIKYLEIG